MKVPIELPEIPGYEYTGEYRVATDGEYVYSLSHKGVLKIENIVRGGHVLRKIEPVKKYRPFRDYEEMKPHRERWVFQVHKDFSIDIVPLWAALNIVIRNVYHKEKVMFDNWDFEDTGEPVGVAE